MAATNSKTLQSALSYLEAGRYEQAQRLCEQILTKHPNDFESLSLGGLAAYYCRTFDKAEKLLGRALKQQPKNPVVLNNYGLVLLDQRRMTDAIPYFQRALAQKADYVDAWINLSTAQTEARQCEAAQETCYSAMEALGPSAELYYCLGQAYRFEGNLSHATACYLKALALDEKMVKAYVALGDCANAKGDHRQMAGFLSQALQYAPNDAKLHQSLGYALAEIKHEKEAEICYQNAIHLDPKLARAYLSYGSLLDLQGKFRETIDIYERGANETNHTGLKLRLALQLPALYPDGEMVDVYRKHMDASLDELLREEKLPTFNPVAEFGRTAFYMAYGGYNVKELAEKVGRIFAKAIPRLPEVDFSECRGRAKPRIGILSRHLYKDHTIGKLTRNIISRLNLDEFDLSIFYMDKGFETDDCPHLAERADLVEIPFMDLRKAHSLVAERKLDLLFYPDIGMDPMSYFLAFSRLARVQCVSWGHPVTTGLPNMDYFLSSQYFEPEDGQDHYSEKLVRLETLLSYYDPPPQAETAKYSREPYGFKDDEHLYGCLQSLFKFHPDFDAVIGEILRRDPKGRLVLLEGLHPNWQNLLLERFQRTLPDVLDRITFLPRMSRQQLMNLMGLCEVLLDTFHFGGGNTAYEAFEMGTPTVTWPGAHMRARCTAGMYQVMGFMDPVASDWQDYVEKALRIGTDAEYRESVRQKIRENNHKLFRDPNVVAEYEAFFRRALAEANTP
jgi:predicted O-linked N-acetylglucosamine transferase (SPINDLY family)